MTCYRWEKGNLLLTVHVQLHAKQTTIIGMQDDKLKIKIASPPIDGRANRELCQFLAQLFAVPKSQVTLVRGQKGLYKRFFIKSPRRYPDFIEVDEV